MPDRREMLLHVLARTAKIVEIGPSLSPVVPKSEGWTSFVLDHATREELVAKYAGHNVPVERIEDVDFIWRNGPLHLALPGDQLGSFDGCIASHVIEHTPDIISFLHSCSAMLRLDGILGLAVPDRRFCFDFFKPLSTTADAIDAHKVGRRRHSRRTTFLNVACNAFSDGNVWWPERGIREMSFEQRDPLHEAMEAYDHVEEDERAPYQDMHAWVFTPKSFELMIRELAALDMIDLELVQLYPANPPEFIAILQRSRGDRSQAWSGPSRMELLRDTVRESAVQAALLSPQGTLYAPDVEPRAHALPNAAGLGTDYPSYEPTFDVVSRFVDDEHRAFVARETQGGLIDIGVPGWLRLGDTLKLYEMAYFADGDILVMGRDSGLASVLCCRALRNARRGRRIVVLENASESVDHAKQFTRDFENYIEYRVGPVLETCDALITDRRRFGFAFVANVATSTEAYLAAAFAKILVNPGGFVQFHGFNETDSSTDGVAHGVLKSAKSGGLKFCGLFGCGALYQIDSSA